MFYFRRTFGRLGEKMSGLSIGIILFKATLIYNKLEAELILTD